MPLKRISDQRSQTLEEFYIELSETSSNAYVDVGKEMLNLAKLINRIFHKTVIWGLTSHARLVLLNEDRSWSPWYVIVSSIGTKEYYLEYLIPSNKQPWENAYVRGVAQDIEQAKEFLLIAMHESGGWSDVAELRQLIKTKPK